jgi:cell division cycle 20-like protein 1 (cofactor of APC complex)
MLNKVSKLPYKVLDAPALADDFYLNLLDWSSSNVLACGLAKDLWIWSPTIGGAIKLVDVGEDDQITSVSW